MQKLAKQYYYSQKGERKINCYKVNLSKELIKQAELDDNKEIIIIAEKNKIIIKNV